MRRGIATCLVLVPLAIGLAGCGYNRGDRAV
jgi:predicted small lipoprotein YifL